MFRAPFCFLLLLRHELCFCQTNLQSHLASGKPLALYAMGYYSLKTGDFRSHSSRSPLVFGSQREEEGKKSMSVSTAPSAEYLQL